MSSIKTSPFPGQNEKMKAVVELASNEGDGVIKLTGETRLCFRLLAEAIIQLGPNIRDGMGDDFEFWKRSTFHDIFEACFGDVDEVLRKTEAEIKALEKEIKEEAAKRGIGIGDPEPFDDEEEEEEEEARRCEAAAEEAGQ